METPTNSDTSQSERPNFVPGAESKILEPSNDTQSSQGDDISESSKALTSSNAIPGVDFSEKESSSKEEASDTGEADSTTTETGTQIGESMNDHTFVETPFFDDVISGRGKKTDNHFGNQNFRRLIRGSCEQYGALIGNAQKTIFVEHIVSRVRATGRFLKATGDGTGFVEMNDEEAKKKVGQSLRYELRKLQTENDAME